MIDKKIVIIAKKRKCCNVLKIKSIYFTYSSRFREQFRNIQSTDCAGSLESYTKQSAAISFFLKKYWT